MVMYSRAAGDRRRRRPPALEDGRLQHVGILFENGGLPRHIYRGFAGDFNGYANDVLIARNCLAVTARLPDDPRAAFEEVGGFSTTFPVNFNDIDYCLKLQPAAGASSTTPTPSSTTSSPPAARPRSRTGRRSSCERAGYR